MPKMRLPGVSSASGAGAQLMGAAAPMMAADPSHVEPVVGTLEDLYKTLMQYVNRTKAGDADNLAGLMTRAGKSPIAKPALGAMAEDEASGQSGDFLKSLSEHLSTQPDDHLTHHTIDELFKVIFGK